jgi:hypothetical protein
MTRTAVCTGKKFDAWTVYIRITLKPSRVKFHALPGLSTYTGHQMGSSKRIGGTVNISDIRQSHLGVDISDIPHLKVKAVRQAAFVHQLHAMIKLK